MTKQWIPPSKIAEVLHLIDNPQNPRTEPQDGDKPGDYEIWFDGGRFKDSETGREYELDGGIEVHVAPLNHFVAHITFADGRVVKISQKD